MVVSTSRLLLVLSAVAITALAAPISVQADNDELFLDHECGASKSCAVSPVSCRNSVECQSVLTVGPANDDASELLIEMYSVTTVKSSSAYVSASLRDPLSNETLLMVCLPKQKQVRIATVRQGRIVFFNRTITQASVLEVTKARFELNSVLCAFKLKPSALPLPSDGDDEDRAIATDRPYQVTVSTGVFDPLMTNKPTTRIHCGDSFVFRKVPREVPRDAFEVKQRIAASEDEAEEKETTSTTTTTTTRRPKTEDKKERKSKDEDLVEEEEEEKPRRKDKKPKKSSVEDESPKEKKKASKRRDDDDDDEPEEEEEVRRESKKGRAKPRDSDEEEEEQEERRHKGRKDKKLRRKQTDDDYDDEEEDRRDREKERSKSRSDLDDDDRRDSRRRPEPPTTTQKPSTSTSTVEPRADGLEGDDESDATTSRWLLPTILCALVPLVL